MGIIYTPKQLLARVRHFDEHLPISNETPWPRCYTSHRHHWIGWLEEQGGPGFYGRTHLNTEAVNVYNRVQNVGMVVWLAEAAGVHPHRVRQALMQADDVMQGQRAAERTARARRMLPWFMVQTALWG